MKIVGICNVWQRNDVFKKMLENWYKYHSKRVHLLVVLSIEDVEREKHEQLLVEYSENLTIIYRKNKFLGRKWNSAIKFALKHLEADYIMKFDSDDLLSPLIWQFYDVYFNKGFKYFGLDRYYCYNTKTDEALLFHYDQVCAARVIHKSLLRNPIYPDKGTCGLDTMSNKVINERGVVVETEYPMLIDLKDARNINSFTLVRHFKNFVTFVNSEELWKNTHLTYSK